MNKKSFSSSLRWIFFVSNRFSNVDRKGRSRATGLLSSLGICVGVMTLVTVVSVMNGFQMSFIDSIMEISSFHLQARGIDENLFPDFEKVCMEEKNVKTVYPFYEAQGLLTSGKNNQNAVVVRAVENDVLEKDSGLKNELRIVSGDFDLSLPENIVIGSYLSRLLDVRVGSLVTLAALSGGKDVALISDSRIFTVKGIFESGYMDINQAYSFVSIESAKKYFGKDSPLVYAIKLKNRSNDAQTLASLSEKFPGADIKSWREYNRSFFGALRIEKNILMLFVFLIFVVVAINIYNGMRRLVFERRSEISTMSAMGAKKWEIHLIFILRGFSGGLLGTLLGVVLSMFLCANMAKVFMFASDFMYCTEYFFTAIFSPGNAMFVRENPMYQVYASIPAKVVFHEVMMISFFGIASPLVSSVLASSSVLKIKIAEVLHDE